MKNLIKKDKEYIECIGINKGKILPQLVAKIYYMQFIY